jgi:hypothetical protein
MSWLRAYSSRDAPTTMEFADAMYLVRPPRFDGHNMPAGDKVVHGPARLRQCAGGDGERADPATA